MLISLNLGNVNKNKFKLVKQLINQPQRLKTKDFENENQGYFSPSGKATHTCQVFAYYKKNMVQILI